MGYCGCMGYEALFPANQLGGLKNVWNLREYGVCEPWVTRESTVCFKLEDALDIEVEISKSHIPPTLAWYGLICEIL